MRASSRVEGLRDLFAIVDDEHLTGGVTPRPQTDVFARLPWLRSRRFIAETVGSQTTNSLPAPWPALRASTRPPCSPTTRRTTLSPSPNPPLLRATCGVGLREGFEYPSQLVRRNADSVVTDAQHGFSPLLFECERDLSSRFGVFDGILQQVGDHLVQPARDRPRRRWAVGSESVSVCRCCFNQRPDRCGGLLHDSRRDRDALA